MITAAMTAQSNRQIEIVHATLQLAFELGPDAVSTSRIASRLGISQPAIYKHFKNKDAIWLAVSDQLAEQFTKIVRNGEASALPPVARLRDLFLQHAQFIQSVPALPDIMVMRNATGSHEVIRRRLQKEMAQLRGLMVNLAEQAQSQGEICKNISAPDIVILIIGVMQSHVLKMIISRDPSHLVRDCARLFDLQIAALAPKGPAP